MSAARRRALGAAWGAAALVVAGCGGGGVGGSSSPQGSSAAGPGASLSLRADAGGALRYDKKTLSAKAGEVKVVMSNPAPLSHNVSIEGNGVAQQGPVVGQGGTSTVSASLKPGSYTFFCSVPGHRQAGMEGTLTVSG